MGFFVHQEWEQFICVKFH